MKLDELLKVMSANPDAGIHMMLPDCSFVPAHFHVTEVGLVRKDFIDCGGQVHSTASCVLQVWVAHDEDHRLNTTKLSHIVNLAAPVLNSKDLPVEIEFERDVVSQYPLTSVEITPSGLLFNLGSKHTACLAPELCLPVAGQSSCGTSNCC